MNQHLRARAEPLQRGLARSLAGDLQGDLQPVRGQRGTGALRPFAERGGRLGEEVVESEREQVLRPREPIEVEVLKAHAPALVDVHEGERRRGGHACPRALGCAAHEQGLPRAQGSAQRDEVSRLEQCPQPAPERPR